jgi:3-oxoisoapionate decarboxylase
MNRRAFLNASAGLLTAGRSLLADVKASRARLGLCTFSCHQHWKAAQSAAAGVRFRDALSFYRYGRELGAEGVQTPLKPRDRETALALRQAVERDNGYYEAEVRLPKSAADLDDFTADVRLAREAGAALTRTVCMSGRRYEVFKSQADFAKFQAQSLKSLQLAEPVLHRERLRLAVENHKDHTTAELVTLVQSLSSEWIGVLVDTGNNIALLEPAKETVEQLAPYAMSVHLKDMAVLPSDEGFLLSEVPLGTGVLDLKRIVRALVQQKPGIVLNLEMATRDPLRIPCRSEGYFATFPDRRQKLAPMLDWVRAHPPRHSPPRISGREQEGVLRDEEANNRSSLTWMTNNV